MRSGSKAARGVAAAVAVLVALPGLGSVPGLADEGPRAAASFHVHISGFAYDPPNVEIAEGDTVVWHNHDGATHTATDDAGGWDTGNLANGASGSITFPAAGSFPYRCTIHPFMTAALEVVGAANALPTVAFTAPAEGASVAGTATLEGTASDADGSVAGVEVRVDGGPWQGAQGTTRWTFAWDTTQVGDGDHTVEARASDDQGAEGAAVARTLRVANPPAVAITAPAPGATVQGTVAVQGTASDPGPGGAVQQVEVRVDGGAWQAAEGTGSWTFAWATRGLANGAHTLEARSSDGALHSALAAVQVTVDNPPNQAPTASFTSPAGGAAVAGQATLRGVASDPDGSVARVEVRVDGGAWQAAQGTTSWSFAWDTTAVADGDRVVEARAIDDEALAGPAASRTFRVANPPAVSIGSPAEGAEVEGVVAVSGAASDPGPAGGVQGVEVRVDGGAWQAAEGGASWTFAWDTRTLGDGEHTLEARSFDGALHSAIAARRVVTDNRHPDLVVRTLAVDGGLASQGIRATVSNLGDEASPAFDVRVSYESAQGLRTIGTVRVAGLGIGQSTEVRVTWDTLLKLGKFGILAEADPQGAVEEHNEANNARAGEACVPAVPLELTCALPPVEVQA